MKALAALVLAVLALTPAAGAQTHPKTEAALACLLGMGRDGCWAVFVGANFNQILNNGIQPLNPYGAARLISYCAEQYVHKYFDHCPAGPLERVEYLGTNVAGGDVYLAKFMHGDMTYVIAQPAPNGKIPAFWRFGSSPTWVQGLLRNVVELKAPAPQPRTLYSATR